MRYVFGGVAGEMVPTSLALLLFLVASTAQCSNYSIVNTTVGGKLAAKRIQNDDTGKIGLQ